MIDEFKELFTALGGNVGLVDKVKDWTEAVRISGELLLQHGCIEPSYIEKMISTCRELGPYIAISPGVAIPHARPEDGAKKVCLSILVVKEGVNFGSHNDPVYVLIAFSTPDKSSHIKVIQQLAKLMMKKGAEMVDRLKKVESEEDILKVLSDLVSK
ncbi:MAG: PTS mannitol transporter subunit IIA [Thermoprotei archaeon]|nr:MAG: PTS mannitol transporter subunit IIA [Thermoprotei archaeon]